MSQHLFAVDRLAAGGSERLIDAGYPLGPHSIVAAISSLGPSTVQAFDGLAIAIAVATCLVAPRRCSSGSSAWRRIAGALLVGFAYLLASTYVQGAFKEAMRGAVRARLRGRRSASWPPTGRSRRRPGPRPLRAIPLAVLAAGALYAYSFPGLLWLAGALGVWAAIELARAARRRRPRAGRRRPCGRPSRRRSSRSACCAGRRAPEIGRMVDFAELRDLRPGGRGPRQPVQPALAAGGARDLALRRLPGRARRRRGPGGRLLPRRRAGGAAALAFGLRWWWRERERAVPAALAAAAVLWLYSLVAGTPYQEAKALVLLAPLVMLVSVRALLERAPTVAEARRILGRRAVAYAFPGRARVAKLRLAGGVATIAFLVGAGGSSLLALANGPVGPSGYSPELAELRDRAAAGSIVVVAPARAARRPARPRLPRLGAARQPDLRRSREGERRRRARASTLAVAIDDDGAVVPAGASATREARRGPGPAR